MMAQTIGRQCYAVSCLLRIQIVSNTLFDVKNFVVALEGAIIPWLTRCTDMSFSRARSPNHITNTMLS